MPLTTQEDILRLGRLGGQQGRNPVGSVVPGQASKSDGAFHHAEFLAPGKGTRKLVSRPMPMSGYELRGEATGILEFPAIEGYETAWISSPGTARSWGISFAIRPLDPGRIVAATGDGQVFFSTGAQIGTHPAGGSDINTVRASFVVASGKYKVRFVWGVGTYDVALEDGGGNPFDMSDWMHFGIDFLNGNPNATLEFRASQQTGPTTYRSITPVSQTAARGWVVHGLYLGGALPSRRPMQGIYSPCPCVVSEVRVKAFNTSSGAAVGVFGAPWVRNTSIATSAGAVDDTWPLIDSTTRPVSLGGRKAWIVGNRVHRSTGITAAQGGSIEGDGTGMLTIIDGERLRETPKTRVAGGVEGHYLELTERTIAVLIDPRRIPWRQQSVERACFLCESTPYATNLGGGVASDPLLGSYPDNIRPSEHLRAEIEHVGTDWLLRVYFGELEPNSLKHPAGTAGGQVTTAWPPALSTAGEPPATWNKPQGDPTAAHGTANGKSAFQIVLGTDSDPTHPMNYSWWVFLQRKFTSQGSGSNACSVWVRRVAVNGTLDTGFAEASDANADASGERHPANQSCFSAARLNGSDINFRTDSYVFTIGGDGSSEFGEEKKSFDATTRPAAMYPVDDVIARASYSDEGDHFPFRGRIASFAVFKKYLLANDRLRIATAGGVTADIRLAFGDALIMSLNFDEAAGNVLRDGRGNDIAFAEKMGLAAIINDQNIEQPQLVGAYPRAAPPWHNECDQFEGEYGAVGAIVQRFNSGLTEEIYAITRAGLYQYDRDAHAVSRVATLPGQGGSGQTCAVVDNADIIHVGGGPGRPVVITREQAVAISGIDPPFYSAPQQIIFASKTITGGLVITFQTKSSQTLNSLVGYEIDDAATVQFAIGYWSDALKTRSRPGNVITARYVDAQFNTPVITSPPTIVRYRLMVSGLPPPRGPNASLISHWEIYRTDSNGKFLILERRIPISSQPVAILIGDIPLGTGESADFFRDIPPEGMKALAVFGDRLVGVAPPEFPRSVVWTKRADPMNWPPIYTASMIQTNAPAAGCIIRRGRAFPFSRDHLYQLIERGLDADITIGLTESLTFDTLAEGVGGLSQFAAITDHDNGIYIAGNKSVYLTEGGTYRSISMANDSAGGAGGDDFSWPDSWDLSDPLRFTSFHDEKRRMVAICGPAADDTNRIDALLIFYERAQIAADGRAFMADPDCSRILGLDATCSAQILDPATGNREPWLGTQLGYIVRFGEFASIGVEYDWMAAVTPKYAVVLSVADTTTLRIEGSWSSFPSTDLFRGATLRVYREGVLISSRRVLEVVISSSWADVTLDGVHDAVAGDFVTIGAIPLDWRSGKMTGESTFHDLRLHAADLAMNE